jgi:two-component system response regulator GlrR
MPRAPGSRARASRDARRGESDLVDLVLYVSAGSRYASAAQRNCQTLLERFDRRRVKLEVCDIAEHPERAEEDAVCYTPMLVKRHPLPRTYVLGDLSNTEPLVGLLESCGVTLKR